MSSISRYRETLHRWGLTDVPFRAAPPEDPAELSRVFYGRQRELDLALPTLYEGRNVLVRGLWGVDKTARGWPAIAQRATAGRGGTR